MAENNDTISTLNNLIETCKDGANGFRTAAEGIEDASIKGVFTNYASERERFASELKREVEKLGGSPAEGGSVSGALHRGWTDIKSAVTGRSTSAIVAEAERGEDVAVENYQEALQANLPSDVKTVVQRQFTQVKAAHDRVRDLEKTYSK